MIDNQTLPAFTTESTYFRMAMGHQQISWDAELQQDLRTLLRLAIREDFDRGLDVTSVPLIPRSAQGNAHVVARQAGIVAGITSVHVLLEEMAADLAWTPVLVDGQACSASQSLGSVTGSARDLLAAERILLNTLAHLCGIATLTRRYVDAVADSAAVICDTRKTLPGWRRLEKYAVRCGGGINHRLGLFDAILIKDNHLAFGAAAAADAFDLVAAIRRAQEFAAAHQPPLLVQVEVDGLEQLQAALACHPQMVLLDNMNLEQLRQSVEMRDAICPTTLLEASGGVRLQNVAAIAACGVDRISVGAITHSAPQLDLGLDWF